MTTENEIGIRLAALELQLGASLPKDYLDFLSSHRAVDEPSMYVSSNPDYWGVRSLFELGTGADFDQVDSVFKMVGDVLPSSCLPVAQDWSGNLYLLDCTEKSSCRVVWWNHERDVEDMSVDFVAPSFADFVALLAYDKLDDE
jgi:cell wall assembly regulator SMI1